MALEFLFSILKINLDLSLHGNAEESDEVHH